MIENSRLRPARADDVALLQAIERDAALRYNDVAETRFCATSDQVRSEREHASAREGGLACVAEAGDAAVGFVLVVAKDGRAHILEVAVVCAAQGRGHGRRMIAAAEAWAAQAGFREMTLTTYRDVPWNAPFYASLGYAPFEVGADRPELGALIAEERLQGFHAAPRVAMRKMLAKKGAG